MRINNPSQAIAALQSDLVRRMQEMRRPRSLAKSAPVSQAAQKGVDAGNHSMQRLQARLSQVALDAPHSRSRVFQIFVDEVLVEHFGEQMMLDPAFFEMAREVQRQMEENPEIAKRVEAFAKQIIAKNSPNAKER
jgi:hypothetical protein